jgi:hypothetical protein
MNLTASQCSARLNVIQSRVAVLRGQDSWSRSDEAEALRLRAEITELGLHVRSLATTRYGNRTQHRRPSFPRAFTCSMVRTDSGDR